MSYVTQAEARNVAAAVNRQVGYLTRLRHRMEQSHRKDDALYAKVVAALDATHSLWVHLHYRGCGVDRPPSGRSESPADVNTGGPPSQDQ